MNNKQYRYFHETPLQKWLQKHPAIKLAQIARDIECSPSYLRGIVKGEKYCTPEMEQKLGIAFSRYGYGLKEDATNGLGWFNAYMAVEDYIFSELNDIGKEHPIIEGNDKPELNTIAAIGLLIKNSGL